MRRPLKYQIMGPMAGVMLVTLTVVGIVEIWLAGRHARDQIERQWQEIGQTLNRSSFPLTDAVLDQLRGLSGAELLLVDRSGALRAATTAVKTTPPSLAVTDLDAPSRTLERRMLLGDRPYFHAAIPLRRPADGGQTLILHSFYPESRYQLAWREAVFPPLTVGLTAIAVVVVVSSLLAVRVTRPVAQLRDQVDRIAAGEYTPVPVMTRNDELRDLTQSVNRLAEMLAGYESQVRRQEQLRTLDQLGGGMAHQLRNAVTGCRMAIDLHRRRCLQTDDDTLSVAVQQLELMEEYVRRFLALGRKSEEPPRRLDLVALVERVLPLVQPRARHLEVDLQWHPPVRPTTILGDADALAQVIVNLLLNAAEAASQAAQDAGVAAKPRQVVIALRQEGATAILDVNDTGPGPPEAVRERIFEPLVSSKPDGAGLGLAIAREVVVRHGGSISWNRRDDRTWFTVQLPVHTEETGNGEAAGGG